MRLLTKLALLLPLFLSCNDHALIEKGIGPRAIVYPEKIEFGHHRVEQNSSILASENIVVINTGDEDLSIQEVKISSISGNSSAFAVTELGDGSPIIPGDSREFRVDFMPIDFESDEGLIEIFTDAAPSSGPEISGDYLTVSLDGYGDAPDISVDPESLDFGNIIVNCEENQRISITNRGNVDLEIYGIDELISSAFPGTFTVDYGSLPPFPWVIPPGQSRDFWVHFYADYDVVNDSSMLDLRVQSNDIDEGEKWISVDGYNEPESKVSETFIASEIPKADIIFVVDDSGSMSSHQANLATQIVSFMSIFQTFGVEYHIGSITTTNNFMANWIDYNHPDALTMIESMIVVGTGGSGNETGLRTITECLESNNCGPNNPSFFRPDAQLVIIFISDEPDHSMFTWSEYKNRIDAIKDPNQVIAHGIIGDEPAGCASYPFGAQSGWGYRELIQAYGGIEISICSPQWGTDLTNIAMSISVPLMYPFSHTNVNTSTIEVYRNGQLIPESHWIYDASRNAVVFLIEYAPDPGDTIELVYDLGVCN